MPISVQPPLLPGDENEWKVLIGRYLRRCRASIISGPSSGQEDRVHFVELQGLARVS
jgi:hypothetical protein